MSIQIKESYTIFKTEQQIWPEYPAGQRKKRNKISYMILIFIKIKLQKMQFLKGLRDSPGTSI